MNVLLQQAGGQACRRKLGVVFMLEGGGPINQSARALTDAPPNGRVRSMHGACALGFESRQVCRERERLGFDRKTSDFS
jgi:hypothetical protein